MKRTPKQRVLAMIRKAPVGRIFTISEFRNAVGIGCMRAAYIANALIKEGVIRYEFKNRYIKV